MYAYQYDGLNRLVNASYVNKDNPIFTDALRETMYYDKNGNIKQLQRFGKLNNDENVGGVIVDNLLYSYATNSKNQLKKVVDLAQDVTVCFFKGSAELTKK